MKDEMFVIAVYFPNFFCVSKFVKLGERKEEKRGTKLKGGKGGNYGSPKDVNHEFFLCRHVFYISPSSKFQWCKIWTSWGGLVDDPPNIHNISLICIINY
jgi:hypothetical protein